MMFQKTAAILMSLCFILSALRVFASTEMPSYEHKETRELTAFVKDAARLVANEGEAAFPQLRRPGSQWFYDDWYVFVTTPEGVEMVNPAFPQLEGKNLVDLRDANGKAMVKSYLRALFDGTGADFTWIHYLWPKPGAVDPSWKSSYVVRVKSPDGKWYAVGTGRYGMRTERYFIMERVTAACRLIEEKGEATFPELRRRDGEFLFRDTYVFVDAEDGTELVNPAFPGLEGRNILREQNAEGRRIVMEYITLAKQKGAGWIGYYWPRPGESEPSLKHTYVKSAKSGGKLFVVGCGAYFDPFPH